MANPICLSVLLYYDVDTETERGDFEPDLAEPVSGEMLVRLADALGIRPGRERCKSAPADGGGTEGE